MRERVCVRRWLVSKNARSLDRVAAYLIDRRQVLQQEGYSQETWLRGARDEGRKWCSVCGFVKAEVGNLAMFKWPMMRELRDSLPAARVKPEFCPGGSGR